ncbi:uncharacterized protein MONOS_3679 [Monocercomonoides exilis]|uniref:uncharacterized protein n=1 Tax=Monocercomonoides exilis TaxID=2049356 RepID=UPI00355A67FE|nr:hypothetical protein MONOS_3679 [Monocercomonoides exilis]
MGQDSFYGNIDGAILIESNSWLKEESRFSISSPGKVLELSGKNDNVKISTNSEESNPFLSIGNAKSFVLSNLNFVGIAGQIFRTATCSYVSISNCYLKECSFKDENSLIQLVDVVEAHVSFAPDPNLEMSHSGASQFESSNSSITSMTFLNTNEDIANVKSHLIKASKSLISVINCKILFHLSIPNGINFLESKERNEQSFSLIFLEDCSFNAKSLTLKYTSDTSGRNVKLSSDLASLIKSLASSSSISPSFAVHSTDYSDSFHSTSSTSTNAIADESPIFSAAAPSPFSQPTGLFLTITGGCQSLGIQGCSFKGVGWTPLSYSSSTNSNESFETAFSSASLLSIAGVSNIVITFDNLIDSNGSSDSNSSSLLEPALSNDIALTEFSMHSTTSPGAALWISDFIDLLLEKVTFSKLTASSGGSVCCVFRKEASPSSIQLDEKKISKFHHSNENETESIKNGHVVADFSTKEHTPIHLQEEEVKITTNSKKASKDNTKVGKDYKNKLKLIANFESCTFSNCSTVGLHEAKCNRKHHSAKDLTDDQITGSGGAILAAKDPSTANDANEAIIYLTNCEMDDCVVGADYHQLLLNGHFGSRDDIASDKTLNLMSRSTKSHSFYEDFNLPKTVSNSSSNLTTYTLHSEVSEAYEGNCIFSSVPLFAKCCIFRASLLTTCGSAVYVTGSEGNVLDNVHFSGCKFMGNSLGASKHRLNASSKKFARSEKDIVSRASLMNDVDSYQANIDIQSPLLHVVHTDDFTVDEFLDSQGTKQISSFEKYTSTSLAGAIQCENVDATIVRFVDFMGVYGTKGCCLSITPSTEEEDPAALCNIIGCTFQGEKLEDTQIKVNGGSLVYVRKVESVNIVNKNDAFCKFIHHGSASDGGGLNIDEVKTLTIKGAAFQDLKARSGGAIWIGSNVQFSTITDITISSCHAASSQFMLEEVSERRQTNSSNNVLDGQNSDRRHDSTAEDEPANQEDWIGSGGAIICLPVLETFDKSAFELVRAQIENCEVSFNANTKPLNKSTAGTFGVHSGEAVWSARNMTITSCTFVKSQSAVSTICTFVGPAKSILCTDVIFSGKWAVEKQNKCNVPLVYAFGIKNFKVCMSKTDTAKVENHWSSSDAGGFLVESGNTFEASGTFSALIGKRGSCITVQPSTGLDNTSSKSVSAVFSYSLVVIPYGSFNGVLDAIGMNENVENGPLILIDSAEIVQLGSSSMDSLRFLYGFATELEGAMIRLTNVGLLTARNINTYRSCAISGGSIFIDGTVKDVDIKSITVSFAKTLCKKGKCKESGKLLNHESYNPKAMDENTNKEKDLADKEEDLKTFVEGSGGCFLIPVLDPSLIDPQNESVGMIVFDRAKLSGGGLCQKEKSGASSLKYSNLLQNEHECSSDKNMTKNSVIGKVLEADVPDGDVIYLQRSCKIINSSLYHSMEPTGSTLYVDGTHSTQSVILIIHNTTVVESHLNSPKIANDKPLIYLKNIHECQIIENLKQLESFEKYGKNDINENTAFGLIIQNGVSLGDVGGMLIEGVEKIALSMLEISNCCGTLASGILIRGLNKNSNSSFSPSENTTKLAQDHFHQSLTTITIRGSTFIGYSPTKTIDFSGPLIRIIDADCVVIENLNNVQTILSDNRLKSSNEEDLNLGGGGLCIEKAEELIVKKTMFEDLSAPKGGGVWIGGDVKKVTMSDVTFKHCITLDAENGNGGGLLIEESLANLKGSCNCRTNSFVDPSSDQSFPVTLEKVKFYGCTVASAKHNGECTNDQTTFSTGDCFYCQKSIRAVSCFCEKGEAENSSAVCIIPRSENDDDRIEKVELEKCEFDGKIRSSIHHNDNNCSNFDCCIDSQNSIGRAQSSRFYKRNSSFEPNDKPIKSFFASLVTLRRIKNLKIFAEQNLEADYSFCKMQRSYSPPYTGYESQCYFHDSYTNCDGGALFVDEVDTLCMKHAYISSCKGRNGGGMMIGPRVVKIYMESTMFSECFAAARGGGLYAAAPILSQKIKREHNAEEVSVDSDSISTNHNCEVLERQASCVKEGNRNDAEDYSFEVNVVSVLSNLAMENGGGFYIERSFSAQQSRFSGCFIDNKRNVLTNSRIKEECQSKHIACDESFRNNNVRNARTMIGEDQEITADGLICIGVNEKIDFNIISCIFEGNGETKSALLVVKNAEKVVLKEGKGPKQASIPLSVNCFVNHITSSPIATIAAIDCDSVIVNNTHFENITAKHGNVLHIDHIIDEWKIANCAFMNCISALDGGAIKVTTHDFPFKNYDRVFFGEDDSDQNRSNFRSRDSSYSSRVCVRKEPANEEDENSKFFVTNATFVRCISKKSGGAIASSRSMNIAGCNFTSCSSGSDGMAIHFTRLVYGEENDEYERLNDEYDSFSEDNANKKHAFGKKFKKEMSTSAFQGRCNQELITSKGEIYIDRCIFQMDTPFNSLNKLYQSFDDFNDSDNEVSHNPILTVVGANTLFVKGALNEGTEYGFFNYVGQTKDAPSPYLPAPFSSANGAGMFIAYCYNTIIANITFRNLTAARGAAVHLSGWSLSMVSLSSVQFSSCYATEEGGALFICVPSNNYTARIRDHCSFQDCCTITSDKATAESLENSGCSSQEKICPETMNNTNPRSELNSPVQDSALFKLRGGAVSIAPFSVFSISEYRTIEFVGSVFDNCSASFGGAVFAEASTEYLTIITFISKCRFVNNVASQSGGAICVLGLPYQKSLKGMAENLEMNENGMKNHVQNKNLIESSYLKGVDEIAEDNLEWLHFNEGENASVIITTTSFTDNHCNQDLDSSFSPCKHFSLAAGNNNRLKSSLDEKLAKNRSKTTRKYHSSNSNWELFPCGGAISVFGADAFESASLSEFPFMPDFVNELNHAGNSLKRHSKITSTNNSSSMKRNISFSSVHNRISYSHVLLSNCGFSKNNNAGISLRSGAIVEADMDTKFGSNNVEIENVVIGLDSACDSSFLIIHSKDPFNASHPSLLCDSTCREHIETISDASRCRLNPPTKVLPSVSNFDATDFPMLPVMMFRGVGIMPFRPMLCISTVNQVPVINESHLSKFNEEIDDLGTTTTNSQPSSLDYQTHHGINLSQANSQKMISNFSYPSLARASVPVLPLKSKLPTLVLSENQLMFDIRAFVDSDTTSFVLTTQSSLNVSSISSKSIPSHLYFFISCDGGYTFTQTPIEIKVNNLIASRRERIVTLAVCGTVVMCTIIGLIVFFFCGIRFRIRFKYSKLKSSHEHKKKHLQIQDPNFLLT